MSERSENRPPQQGLSMQPVDALFVVQSQYGIEPGQEHQSLVIPSRALQIPRNIEESQSDHDIVAGIWETEQPMMGERAGRIQVERVLITPDKVLFITPEGHGAATFLYNYLRLQEFQERGGDTRQFSKLVTQAQDPTLSTSAVAVSRLAVAQTRGKPPVRMTVFERQSVASLDETLPVWMALEAIFRREMEQGTESMLRIPRIYGAMDNREKGSQVFFIEALPNGISLLRIKEDLLRNRGRGAYSQGMTDTIEELYENAIFFLKANLELYGPSEAKRHLQIFREPKVPNLLISPPDPQHIREGQITMYLLDFLLG